MSGTSDAALTLAVIAAAIGAYWLPTFIAFGRHVPGRAQVVIVNLFLGWTLIGWVVALVMAFRPVPPAAVFPLPPSNPPGLSRSRGSRIDPRNSKAS